MNLIKVVFITTTIITITAAVSAISATGSRGLLGSCCWQRY
ncbi:hypothetical protein [Lactobacillus delbrueckii]